MAADLSIVPGKSVGPVHLGQPLTAVERIFGPPHEGDTAMGRLWMAWKEHNQVGRIGVFCRRPDEHQFVIVRIRVTSARYSTSAALAVGSTIDEIRKHYPDIEPASVYKSIDLHKTVTVYDSVHRGIAFEVASAPLKRVSRCIAIIVHESNTAIQPAGGRIGEW